MRYAGYAGCAVAVLAAGMSVSSARAAEMDAMTMALVSVERLEYRVQDGSDVGFVEGGVAIGNDAHKLVLGVKAARELDEGAWEEAELQALYRRPVSDFFDVQAGLRHDFEPGTGATFLAAGVAGLAPQFIELEAMGYVSTDGDASLRVEAETEIFLTRRIFAVPLVEIGLSASENASRGVGQGLAMLETGLRVHHVLDGGLAPYVGVSNETLFGETADFARAAGKDRSTTAILAGVRLGF